jgi:hypothetical protein
MISEACAHQFPAASLMVLTEEEAGALESDAVMSHSIDGIDESDVEAAQARWVVVHVDVPYGSGETGSHKIWFDIDDPHNGTKVVEASVFLIPR